MEMHLPGVGNIKLIECLNELNTKTSVATLNNPTDGKSLGKFVVKNETHFKRAKSIIEKYKV